MSARTRPDDSAEIVFENAKVSLCLLHNRHARTFRIVDFRSGADPTKRGMVMSLAQREGVERVFTVVERDEVSSWTRLGFRREGTIAAFYKRSDAFVLGADVPEPLERAGREQSDIIPRAAAEAPEAAPDPDKTYQRARRLMKRDREAGIPKIRLQRLSPENTRKAVAAAARSSRALTRFERFGRDVTRREFLATARGGFSLALSVETQVCFDNAFIELLTAPKTDREVSLTLAALAALADLLEREGIVGAFSLSPANDPGLASVYLGAGFRRTGLLPRHFRFGSGRCDAFLWSRRLALPDAD